MINSAEIKDSFQLYTALRVEVDFILLNENLEMEDVFLCLLKITAEYAAELNVDKPSVLKYFEHLITHWEEIPPKEK